jgi:hypothetical protein
MVLCIQRMATTSKLRSPVTHYLNVDLDIYSRYDLQPLVSRLGRKVSVLYVGRESKRYCAHLELANVTSSANSTIHAFCRLIQALPKAELHLWNVATKRSFSVGVQAGETPTTCDFAIRAKTVKAVSEVAAEIVLTIYAPEQLTTSLTLREQSPRPQATSSRPVS